MGIVSSKNRRVEPCSLKRGEIVISRGAKSDLGIKRPVKYGVYVGDGDVIEYTNAGNSLGEISVKSLNHFMGNAVLRIRGKGIFRCEHTEAVNRAMNLYTGPAEEWKHYDYRFRHSETFVNHCANGKPYGKAVIARRKAVRRLATNIYRYIPWKNIQYRNL